MKDSVYEFMLPEERALWSGKVEPFETLDATHKKKFLIKTVLLAVISIVLIVAYIAIALSNLADLKIPVVVLLMLIAMAPTVNFFLDAARLKKKVRYVITDKRLIVIRDFMYEVEFEKIKEAEMRSDEDGHTSLLCGEYGRKLKNNQIRNRTVIGVAICDEDSGICKQFCMYALPEPEKVKQILKKYIPIV